MECIAVNRELNVLLLTRPFLAVETAECHIL